MREDLKVAKFERRVEETARLGNYPWLWYDFAHEGMPPAAAAAAANSVSNMCQKAGRHFPDQFTKRIWASYMASPNPDRFAETATSPVPGNRYPIQNMAMVLVGAVEAAFTPGAYPVIWSMLCPLEMVEPGRIVARPQYVRGVTALVGTGLQYDAPLFVEDEIRWGVLAMTGMRILCDSLYREFTQEEMVLRNPKFQAKCRAYTEDGLVRGVSQDVYLPYNTIAFEFLEAKKNGLSTDDMVWVFDKCGRDRGRTDAEWIDCPAMVPWGIIQAPLPTGFGGDPDNPEHHRITYKHEDDTDTIIYPADSRIVN